MFKVQDADKLQILAAMRGSLASHGIGSVIDGVFLRFDSSHLDKFFVYCATIKSGSRVGFPDNIWRNYVEYACGTGRDLCKSCSV